MKFITSIIQWFWNVFYSLFTIVFSSVRALIVMFGALPDLIQAFLIAIVAVSVIYKLVTLGKSGE